MACASSYTVYKISCEYLLMVWYHLGPDSEKLSEVYCNSHYVHHCSRHLYTFTPLDLIASYN